MTTKQVVNKNFETIQSITSSKVTQQIQSITSSEVTQQIIDDTSKLVYEIEDADEADDMNEYTGKPNPDARTILILPSGKSISGTNENAILWKWHKTSGCISCQYLLKIAKNCKGMEQVQKLSKDTSLPTCDACLRTKSQRKSPKKAVSHCYREVMYLMHTDMSGIIKTLTLSCSHYFAVFIDDASRYRFVALLHKKSDWLKAFDTLTICLGRHPKILCGDNTKELSMHGHKVKAYLKKHRIFNELCSPHEHDQNPVAEGMIGSLLMRASCVLINANTPKWAWGLCVQYAAELENRFCPFMKAYLNVEKQHRTGGKFVNTSIPLVYVGTALHMGYKEYLLSTKDGRSMYIACHNVTIDWTVFPWCKPAPLNPNEPKHPMQLMHDNTLESMDDTNANIVNPEYVVQLELANEKDNDNYEVRSITTRN
eukprot:2674967-Rhodomonas_salina.2